MGLPHQSTYRRSYSALLSALLSLTALSLNTTAQGQERELGPKAAGKPPAKTASKLPKDLWRWRSLLDESRYGAQALPPGEGRPYALAEVADAYWAVDHTTSVELFSAAVAAAAFLRHENKDAGDLAAGFILTLAARRSSALLKSLTNQLNKLRTDEAQAKVDASSEVESVALELLKTDPKQAAQLMKVNASEGPSMGASWLVFQIAERDPAAAEDLYRAFLERFAAGANRSLEHLLWLAGFPFGYGEAYGGAKDPARFIGFGGLRVKGLVPNPPLASAFLDLAFQDVNAALQQAAVLPEPEGDLLTGLALFVAGYCLPEVERYRPLALPAWYALYQAASTQTSPTRRAAVAAHLQKITQVRVATSNKSPEEYAREQAKKELERAESLPDGCERDRAYAQAALNANYARGFARALELVKKIKNDSVARSLTQYIYYDMAAKAFDAGDAAEGDKYTEMVTATELRTLLHLKAARAALRRKDSAHAAQSIRRAINSADRISEPRIKAGVMLAAVEIYAAFDQAEATLLLGEAVKVINRLPNFKGGGAPVLRKVNFNCGESDNSWHGSFDQGGRLSLFEILATLTTSDVEGVLSIAYSLEDPATRIRALAVVAKAELTPRLGAKVAGTPQP